MNRRDFLLGSGLVAAGALGGAAAAGLSSALAVTPERLTIQKARFRLRDQLTNGMVSLSADSPPPVIRMAQGEPFAIDIANGLADYTTMHWHGIRVPNAMDGVPYLTQIPMAEGEAYRYAFTPEDAGTYWYHPHCMTMDQMALGLTGILVVEGRDDPGFDSDVPLNLRDFRLGKDDQFKELYTARGAARGGTLGTVITANWHQEDRHERRSGSLVRLRLAATDTARIYKIVVTGTDGRIIAFDGHPLEEALAWPTEDAPLLLSPGQRADIAVRMPDTEGEELIVQALVQGRLRPLARVRATGASLGRDLAELKPLAPNPLARPDLAAAETHEFVFGWSPSDTIANNGFCGTLGYTFWSINREAWPGDAAPEAGPLATLELGKSYVLRLRNESPNAHPIHLHGLTFLPIRSNKRALPKNWTDTALLLKNETMDIALVADNPGDWAFHCHVIEHQKTGLAGFIRVREG